MMVHKWIKSNTLSSKHKDFEWYFSDIEGLIIKRIFKGDKEQITVYSLKELEQIINYVFMHDKVELSNNVEKLLNGDEKEGLGKFVYEKLGKSIVDAQATSHLAAIFVLVEIFEYNGATKNMEFWLKFINWQDRLNQYMNQPITRPTFKAKINHITYSVEDLNKSISFYENVLNAKLVAKGKLLAYLDLNGIWLALNVEEGLDRVAIAQSYSHIAFEVTNEELRETFERLFNLGVDIDHGRTRNQREGNSIYVKDPDGHMFEFHTSNLKERLDYYMEEREDIEVYI